MIRAKADNWHPSRYTRRLQRRLIAVGEWFAREIEITNGSCVYRFRCETVREFNRCLKVFSKEPGTVSWINSDVEPGQVFYDIGANIGVYTILAARRLSPNGRVYAFEPHVANHASLLKNILLNDLQEVVTPCSFALHSEEGFSNFRYNSTNPGVSDNQFAAAAIRFDNAQAAQLTELKFGTTIDCLLERGAIQYPHHVKIDADGNEHMILQGMTKLLAHPKAPLTVQVELNEPDAEATAELFMRYHYNLDERHYARSSMRRIINTGSTKQATCNAIFRLTNEEARGSDSRQMFLSKPVTELKREPRQLIED
jgi:FkbM family methyltransferase